MLGGSNRVGLSAEAFTMPAGHVIRYDLPSPKLRELVSAYGTYGSCGQSELVRWLLPAPPRICVLLHGGRVQVAIRNYRCMPEAAGLYGPTSTAFSATRVDGIQIGVGLTALGWVRLTSLSANTFLNRVVPLSELLPAQFSRSLVGELNALRDETLIAPTLDELLVPIFTRSYPHESVISKLTTLMARDSIVDVAEVADRLAIPSAALRRVTVHAFGLPPKVLLRRARFLRSFFKLISSGDRIDLSLIDKSYHDRSHFIRDANSFLGTTVRRFMTRETTFLSASLKARAAAIGAPMHALHTKPQECARNIDLRTLSGL